MTESYYTDPWQTREVLDPKVESGAYRSIVDIVFDYGFADMCHFMMTNYTWETADIDRLYTFYKTKLNIRDKLNPVQERCQKAEFEKLTTEFGDSKLPMYSKGVHSERLVQASRVYHDARQYLDNGFADEEEISRFASSVLKETLDPLFSAKEINKIVRPLVKSLMESEAPNDEIGESIEKNQKYALADSLQDLDPEFPGFHEKLPGAMSNFLGYFALHTIRHHCYVSFGVDGQLKVYQRDMYKKAKKELRKQAKEPVYTIKQEKISDGQASIKKEPQVAHVKSEPKDSDDDCVIMEAKPTRKRKVTEPSENRAIGPNAETDSQIEELKKATNVSIEFKTWLLNLFDENERLRSEIHDNRELFSMKMAEKRKKLG